MEKIVGTPLNLPITLITIHFKTKGERTNYQPEIARASQGPMAKGSTDQNWSVLGPHKDKNLRKFSDTAVYECLDDEEDKSMHL